MPTLEHRYRDQHSAPVRGPRWHVQSFLGDTFISSLQLVFVFGLIVVFYSLIIQVTYRLFFFAFGMFGDWPGGAANVLWGIATLALLVLAAWLAWHSVNGVLALIMARHDVVPEEADGILLPREFHGKLHDLVDEVATRVRTIAPNELRVAQWAHCYAVEKRHLGIEKHNRYVLVLGLPHLEVLTKDELRVIIGHELAHFLHGDTIQRLFLFRFLASLQAVERGMRLHWSKYINPLYFFCRLYSCLTVCLTAPLQKRQELRADRLSAAEFGGSLAATTLLNEWRLASQFDLIAAQVLQELAVEPRWNVFRRLREEWCDFSADGLDYLKARLLEEERESYWDSRPTTPERIAVMEPFPSRGQPDREPASGLVSNLIDLENELQRRLVKELMALANGQSHETS